VDRLRAVCVVLRFILVGSAIDPTTSSELNDLVMAAGGYSLLVILMVHWIRSSILDVGLAVLSGFDSGIWRCRRVVFVRHRDLV
jgi:hypothetical protein